MKNIYLIVCLIAFAATSCETDDYEDGETDFVIADIQVEDGQCIPRAWSDEELQDNRIDFGEFWGIDSDTINGSSFQRKYKKSARVIFDDGSEIFLGDSGNPDLYEAGWIGLSFISTHGDFRDLLCGVEAEYTQGTRTEGLAHNMLFAGCYVAEEQHVTIVNQNDEILTLPTQYPLRLNDKHIDKIILIDDQD